MKEFNVDLHLHGLYSGGVSKNMTVPVIAEQSRLKGLDVVGCSDFTHKEWLAHLEKELVEESNGVYTDRKKQVNFVFQTELHCARNLHHIVFVEDLARARELREKLMPFGQLDGWGNGRPRLRLTPEQLAEKVEEVRGLIGPAHAFTPYFSVYAHFDSVREAYGKIGGKIDFIELGLSADSATADLIKENHAYHFLTSSDAHSPWPHRMGREFTRVRLAAPNFKALRAALASREEGVFTLNVGLDPREGKYHLTACNACYKKVSLEAARNSGWKCRACGGRLKKGVRDRIAELASFERETHPAFRPPYLHALPLAEILQAALKLQSPMAARVQEAWLALVERFGNEIAVLVDVSLDELREVDAVAAQYIEAFRRGWVAFDAGGGGRYGTPYVCLSKEEFDAKQLALAKEGLGSGATGQKRLGEF